MIERITKAMVGVDLRVIPIEAMYDNEANQIICFREIKETNGVFVVPSDYDAEWVTPKDAAVCIILYDTVKEAQEYASERKRKLSAKLSELENFIAEAEKVFPGKLKTILRSAGLK